MKTICTKPKQVKAWIDTNKMLLEFYEETLENGVFYGLNTREETIRLIGFYNRRYLLAKEFESLLEVEE
jgi:hypothetical protein